MKIVRSWASLAVLVAVIASPRAGQAASFQLVVPDGVTRFRGIMAITSVGAGPGFGHSAEVAAMASRLSIGLVFLSDENAFGAYETRCTGGEFQGVLDGIAKLGMDMGHPEMANAPIIAAGHSHGGDYWNYFNACMPQRFAVVFDKSGGGVQYMGAALKTPMVWEIGTNDLRNNHAGVFRGEMFAHRIKGSPLSLVLGPGEDHSTFTAGPRQMAVDLIEAIWKLRVPEDADPMAGPVKLNEIDESKGQYWLGDNYSRTFTRYADSPDKDALYKTSFLPTEEVARKWTMAGANLPADVKLDTGGVCTTCYQQPAGEPSGAPVAGGPSTTPPPAGADAGAPAASSPDAAPVTSTPPGTTTPPAGNSATPDASAPVSVAPPPRRTATGGCSVAAGGRGGAGLALLAMGLLLARVRRRRG
jgi:MYXO-CTERM domain-containing protein